MSHAAAKFGADGSPYKVSGRLARPGRVGDALSEWLVAGTVLIVHAASPQRRSRRRRRGGEERHRHDDFVPARRGDLRGARALGRDATRGCARRPSSSLPHRRARGCEAIEFHYEGGIREEAPNSPRQCWPRTRSTRASPTSKARTSSGRSESGDAVERVLPGIRLHLCQQHTRMRAARTAPRSTLRSRGR